MGVATLPDNDFLHPQFLGNLSVFEGYLGQLNIIVPHAIVYGIVADQLAGQCPANASLLEDYGKGGRIFRPGQKFTRIVD